MAVGWIVAQQKLLVPSSNWISIKIVAWPYNFFLVPPAIWYIDDICDLKRAFCRVWYGYQSIGYDAIFVLCCFWFPGSRKSKYSYKSICKRINSMRIWILLNALTLSFSLWLTLTLSHSFYLSLFLFFPQERDAWLYSFEIRKFNGIKH